MSKNQDRKVVASPERLKAFLRLRTEFAAAGMKAPGVRACEKLGYARGPSAWANSAKLWREVRRHPLYQDWCAELLLKSRSSNNEGNPLEEKRREEALAEYLAKTATPGKSIEQLRREREAVKHGVSLEEIGELPPGPPPRWDARGDKLDPYRPDPVRRIPTQGEVNRIMRPPRFSMMDTYRLKPAPRTRFYGWR
jgi:hypothetical protein